MKRNGKKGKNISHCPAPCYCRKTARSLHKKYLYVWGLANSMRLQDGDFPWHVVRISSHGASLTPGARYWSVTV